MRRFHNILHPYTCTQKHACTSILNVLSQSELLLNCCRAGLDALLHLKGLSSQTPGPKENALSPLLLLQL